MTAVQVLTLIGTPSIVAAFIMYVVKKLHQNRGDNKALKIALQALLRSKLIEMWEKYRERGYAPIYARENFLNLYEQYHTLGANGVMDDIRKRFMELPDKRPNQRNGG